MEKEWTAEKIVRLYEDENNEDFVAILCDEYFPQIEGTEFWDMRTDIDSLRFAGEDEGKIESVYDLFTEAFCSYHQVPDISHLSFLRK